MRRPSGWYSETIDFMIDYMNNYDFVTDTPTSEYWQNAQLEVPDKVCIRELWLIALRQREPTINRFHRDLIYQALEKLGWEVTKINRRFGVFGTQRSVLPQTDSKDLPF